MLKHFCDWPKFKLKWCLFIEMPKLSLFPALYLNCVDIDITLDYFPEDMKES